MIFLLGALESKNHTGSKSQGQMRKSKHYQAQPGDISPDFSPPPPPNSLMPAWVGMGMSPSNPFCGCSSSFQLTQTERWLETTYLPEQEVAEPYFPGSPYQDVRIRRMAGIEALIKQRLRDITKVSGEETKISTHLFLDYSHSELPYIRLSSL